MKLYHLSILLAVILISCKSEKEPLYPEFAKIPAGEFTMGADIDPQYIVAGEQQGFRSLFIQDEFPIRNVTITQPFEISKYEITNAQYEAFDPDHIKWRGNFMDISTGDNEAAVYVSWEEAVAFTEWLTAHDPDYLYRLPTEAEWEYVARAGTRTTFSNGETGDIYELNPFDSLQMQRMNYQWPHPFTWSNGCRGWVTWLTEECTGVVDVYPGKNDIKTVDLTVGHHGPNTFGVYDMHGGVEEWVLDWYDIYSPSDTFDPVGPVSGDFKVIRGGSHNNHVYHTRSANRMALATNDKSYFTGFRVVRVPKNQHLPEPAHAPFVRSWAEDVSQNPFQWQPDRDEPVFEMTSLYELVPMFEDGSHYGSREQLIQFGFDPETQSASLEGPLYTHNHSATIDWTENGDILVSWFSGENEVGPELTLLGSRGKRMPDGSLEWTAPAEFLKAADRNMHGSNLLNNSNRLEVGLDDQFVLHQMASIGIAGRWDKLALGYRSSTDNGKTWTPVEMILELNRGFNDGCQIQGNMFQTSDGKLVFVSDDERDDFSVTSSLIITDDGGKTWYRRGHSSDTDDNDRIAGLHAAVIEVDDVNGTGKPGFLAIARDDGGNFKGLAPMSISVDDGRTWQRSPSVFPSIRGIQRMTMLRLKYSKEYPDYPGKTPIMFTGFADEGFLAKNAEGQKDTIKGLFTALSFDEGKTWPEEYRKVVSNVKGDDEKVITTAPWQRVNTLAKDQGQEIGYMSVCQSPDGMIYLTDGKIIYSYNLAWILE